MKVLFAVNDESVSESIVKKYQKEYKEILSYKNVYYFNAILKEIQKDKSYDRIVISEDLESFSNNNYDAIDKFIFEKLDDISDEAQDIDGNETSIIFICTDRRVKGTSFLVKLFGIGIYNALLGNDRSKEQVCKLINKPRVKKEAKLYYKIDSEDVNYSNKAEEEVSEVEIQNILIHFKKLGKNTDKFAESFNNIASQYTDEQLKIIINCLPNNVKSVLEADCKKYREIANINGMEEKINKDNLKNSKNQTNTGIKIGIIGNKTNQNKMSGPIVVPSSVRTSKNKGPQSIRPIGKSIEIPKTEKNENIQTKKIVRNGAKPQTNLNVNNEKDTIEKVKKVENEEVSNMNSKEKMPEKGEKIIRKDGKILKKKVKPQEDAVKPNTVKVPKKRVLESNDNTNEMKKPKVETKKIHKKVPPLKKNQKDIVQDEDDLEDDVILPGMEDDLESNEISSDIDNGYEETEEIPLPDDEENEEDTLLPGLEDEDSEEDEDDTLLPGLDDEDSEEDEEDSLLPGLDEDEDSEEDEDDTLLPGLDDEDSGEIPSSNDNNDDDDEYEIVDEDEESNDDEELEEDSDDEEYEVVDDDETDGEDDEYEIVDDDEESNDEETLEEDSDDEEYEVVDDDETDGEDDEYEIVDDDEESNDEEALEEDSDDEYEVVDDDENTQTDDSDEEIVLEDDDFDDIQSNMDDTLEDDDYSDEVPLPDIDELDDFQEDGNTEDSFTGADDEEEDSLLTDSENDDEDDYENDDENDELKSNESVENDDEQNTELESIKPKVDYSMSSLNSLITKDKKIVTFLGTTKNGTSFLINNLAALFSSIGINTAILDMTKNKNSYYIYTNNEEELRNIAYNSIYKLQNGGIAEGIKVNNNLSVYTALPNDGKDYSNAEPILSTLVQNHSLILIDCDFDTDPSYFASCQEIYLVQSMDILTIQPLTAFLRNLKSQGVLEPEKVRVVINKELKVRSLTTKAIIAGMSFYNDPSMSFMTELFNKDMVKACSIPFEENAYSRYLDAMVNCNVSINDYSKQFMSKLRNLADMVYPLVSKSTYGKNSTQINYGKTNFSSNINNTLNQMKKKY